MQSVAKKNVTINNHLISMIKRCVALKTIRGKRPFTSKYFTSDILNWTDLDTVKIHLKYQIRSETFKER